MRILLFLVSSFLATAYAQKPINIDELTLIFEDSIPKMYINKTNNKYTGEAISFKDSLIQIRQLYKDGTLLKSITYYHGGSKETETNYNELGNEVDSFYIWDTSGRIKLRGYFLDGKRQGVWWTFNNGKIESIGQYSLDYKDGIWKYYNEAGELEKREFYINGTLTSSKIF